MAKKTAAGKFPKVLVELEKWVNGGKAGEIDFEMYQSFNEQYKPSDWIGNPAADEELLSFGMDGMGGQVAIWRAKNAEFDELPVVFLGSEGEVLVLATDLPTFLATVAQGVGPLEAASETTEGEENADMLTWVKKTYPKHKVVKPEAALKAAKKAYPKFEEHVMSLRPA